MSLRRIQLTCLILSLCAVSITAWLAQRTEAASPEPALAESLARARGNGKYRMLLRQFKVEKDAETYGDLKELGLRNLKEYAGQTDLPNGYWLYVKPYWYIWGELASVQRPKRNWGPEQATGQPDTDGAGDIVTAWASASPDEQDEWLMLEYDEPVMPTAVDVYETYNPGALQRITAFKLDGQEVELWKGDDPTPATDARGVSQIPVKADFKTTRIKIYLASKAVAGWNEIDAVGLHEKNKIHWAVAAAASSTYAQPFTDTVATTAISEDRFRGQRLEQEIQALKMQFREMQIQIKKDRDERQEQDSRILKSLDELKKLVRKDK